MDIDTQFDEFWRHYPRGRKTAKADARRKFIAIVTGKHKDLRATADQLIAGAMRYAEAIGNHHPYVKMPSTWLNGGCWEDEDLAPPAPQGKGLPALPGTIQMPGRVSTRERSLYDDLADRSWAEGEG